MPLPDVQYATAWLRLTLTPGVTAGAQHALLKHFGSPHAALQAPREQVARVCGAPVAQALARGPLQPLLDRTLAWLEHPAHHLVTFAEDEYPALLLETPDPPALLYASGRLELLAAPCIGIVGSRNATPRGAQDAEELAQAISAHGICITSGMARGIDAAAHRGGLRARGSSIAVLGTGADVVYPRGHEELARSLSERGCLLSELPLGMHPDRWNFPRRNRLISGLSRGVVVVEAAPESGSLITARLALEQNRDVFAVPGSIHATHSKGCHALIKDGAKLVETAADVLSEYGLAPRPAPEAAAASAARAHPLLHAMGFAPMCVDELVLLTGLQAAEVAAQLSKLEIDGRVKPLGGGRFQRQEGSARVAL